MYSGLIPHPKSSSRRGSRERRGKTRVGAAAVRFCRGRHARRGSENKRGARRAPLLVFKVSDQSHVYSGFIPHPKSSNRRGIRERRGKTRVDAAAVRCCGGARIRTGTENRGVHAVRRRSRLRSQIKAMRILAASRTLSRAVAAEFVNAEAKLGLGERGLILVGRRVRHGNGKKRAACHVRMTQVKVCRQIPMYYGQIPWSNTSRRRRARDLWSKSRPRRRAVSKAGWGSGGSG